MEIQLRDRPDGLDKAILRYIQNAQTGATIPEIHRAVCPRQRESLVRYRVETLNAVGLLRLIRVFGRIVVFPDDGAQPARGEIANG